MADRAACGRIDPSATAMKPCVILQISGFSWEIRALSVRYGDWARREDGFAAAVGKGWGGDHAPEELKPAGSVGRKAFETAVTLHTGEPYVAARAKDASGRVLATSRAVRPGDQASYAPPGQRRA